MDRHPVFAEIDMLRGEVDALKALVAAVVSNDDKIDEPQAKFPQCICKNCSGLLGVYNTETHELQIRVKDQYVYVKGSPGSCVRIICRRCLTEARLDGE